MARQYKPSTHLTRAQKDRAMIELHKKWTPHEKQKEVLKAIYADGYKKIFIRAGRKWGKNEICNYLGWRTSIQIKMAESYIIGSTAEAEKKIIWNNERLQNFGPFLNQDVDDTNLILKFPWKSFIQIDGSRNKEDGRGRSFDLCIFDEGKDQNKDYYEGAYPNLLAKNGLLVFIGTPPDIDDEKGDFFRAVEAEAIHSSSWKYFHYTSYDNPHMSAKWLDEERAAHIRRGEGHIFDREYMAKDVTNSKGKVFPHFSELNHVRPIEVLLAEVKRGLAANTVDFFALADPGTDVFAVLLLAYNRETKQMYVLDEIYETDRYKTSSSPMWEETQGRKRILQEYIPFEVWRDVYDEAASHYEVEVFNKFGVQIHATNKKAGKGKDTHVSLLKDAMSVPKSFQVASHCVNTKREISRCKDINKDKDNHTLDILRYYIDECGYNFQSTRERLVIEKHKLIEPRGVPLEVDAQGWQSEEDPFDHLMDFTFDTTEYSDIYGF